jgi:hypothetical protein
MMKNKTVTEMTDRIFTSTDTFQVSDRVGDMTVYAYNDGSITVQIDKSRSEWAQFNITCDEFQAMFDWAKAQGFVK